MSGRSSARSSATRDQPTTLKKQPPDRQSHSPIRRQTRSQSADVGQSNAVTDKKRAGKRGARQASVESVGSNASAASSRTGRTKKAARGAPVNRDLSMVMEEGREPSDGEGQEENEQDEDEQDEEIDDIERGGNGQRSQSPGAMSGTTAFSSFSTYSQSRLKELDPTMVEYLPDLFSHSCKILNLLAPEDHSEELVSNIARELHVIDSKRAKRLRVEEEKFQTIREHFGDEDYLDNTLILHKLLGPDPGVGDFRPDAIIHAANLAAVVKGFLVLQQGNVSMEPLLDVLDTYFPQPFINKFHSNPEHGNSELLEDTLALGLDIRTQYAILIIKNRKDDQNRMDDQEWNPDQILANIFYHPLPEGDSETPYFEDGHANGRVIKSLLRGGPANSNDQDDQIQERVNLIRSFFRGKEAAVEQGDLVDFEQLDEQFPWPRFRAELVSWSRARLEEINRSIEKQGGVKRLTKTLIEAMKSKDSQVGVSNDPPVSTKRRPELLPPANITRKVIGQSIYSKENARRLKQLKKGNSSLDGPSSTTLVGTATTSNRARQNNPGPSRVSAAEPRATVVETEREVSPYQPVVDEDNGEIPSEEPRPSQQYLDIWNASINDKNKENRPLPKTIPVKRRLLDRQSDAEELRWDSESQETAGPSKRKPPRQERQETEESEDQGYQVDQRAPNPARRMAPPARSRSLIADAPPNPKRPRTNNQEAEKARLRAEKQAAEDARLQASARAEAEEDESSIMEEDIPSRRRRRARPAVEEEEEESMEEDVPRPSTMQISASARVRTSRAQKEEEQRPQVRTKWSERDSQTLIALIERWGCSWAFLEKKGKWEVERGQVALKDKARNLKVDFLISGVPLPENFDKIPLGAKEIRRVHRVHPDWEPEYT
ncbi:hypothetical protein G7Y89_g13154 [Cudoniella acicularis]|uniref:Myb-like domain-containing protein n=1 Tax=Cudoniella acicularis TaxID=354080 RepID=A0A8H4RA56_9HELO|nr:hypothetical protein G7Y89_g13154 [Cudoniella acicularis]